MAARTYPSTECRSQSHSTRPRSNTWWIAACESSSDAHPDDSIASLKVQICDFQFGLHDTRVTSRVGSVSWSLSSPQVTPSGSLACRVRTMRSIWWFLKLSRTRSRMHGGSITSISRQLPKRSCVNMLLISEAGRLLTLNLMNRSQAGTSPHPSTLTDERSGFFLMAKCGSVSSLSSNGKKSEAATDCCRSRSRLENGTRYFV